MRLYPTSTFIGLTFGLLLATSVAAADLPPVTKTDHLRGSSTAPVTIVEYTDFQCPFCQRHYRTMLQVFRREHGQVNWVYRPYPLSFHEHALPTAIAAECVSKLLGERKFWRFHDTALGRLSPRDELDATTVRTLALNLGANGHDYDTCIARDDIQLAITKAQDAGTQAGVNGTPTNFVVVNATGTSEMVMGAVPLQTMMEAVGRALGQE